MAPAPKNSDSALALQAAIDGDLYLLKGAPPSRGSLRLPFGLEAAPSFGSALFSFDLSTSLGRDARFQSPD